MRYHYEVTGPNKASPRARTTCVGNKVHGLPPVRAALLMDAPAGRKNNPSSRELN